MDHLRRLFGGDRNGDRPAAANSPETDAGGAPVDEDERARELELARFEQDRVDDLVRRQQRYADRSWTPPRQGGELRAEDNDRSD